MMRNIHSLKRKDMWSITPHEGSRRGRLWLRRWSGLSPDQKVGGLIPMSPISHSEVSSGKILNHKLNLDSCAGSV